ncbi:PTS sugar transporter subunit IIA [Enterococcus hailinensis]|uniref:PTS sugar transporter subunit IIA n=1 Tax=Enterococcus hailinensis TaxID=3238988 RepID=UPI0038B25174
MEITDLMMNDLVIFDETIRSKNELFERLANELERTKRVTKAKKIMKDLYKREKETSTGIEDGFGIPHAKSKHVLEPTVCFIHTEKLSDYLGLDGQPIECSFAILVPSKSSDIHLDILSSLSRKLMNEGFRKELKAARSGEEVLSIINKEES